jgi:hypothetical protein
MKLRGHCHCQTIEFEFDTTIALEELPVRACQCTFCRKHAGLTTADPDGHLKIVVKDEAALSRYRFGLGITDFLVCRHCGVYVAAAMVDGERLFAVVNVNAMADSAPFDGRATPMSYDGESVDARVARRRRVWTPAEIVIAAPAR